MSLLNSLGQFTSALQIGGSVASLVSSAKALMTPKKFEPGIGGFVFDIPETETVKLQAQITHHFAQDNYAIQDHVAFEPITITLVGDVGELVMARSPYEKFAEQALATLAAVPILSPAQSTSAARYLSEITRLKLAVETAKKQFDSIAGAFGFQRRDKDGNFTIGDTRTNQQRAYDTLAKMFYGRTEVTCETPWRTFGGAAIGSIEALEIGMGQDRVNGQFPMMIESVEFFQDSDTKDMSKVTVTLREFRAVNVDAGKGGLQERAEKQAAPKAKKGKVAGADASFAKSEISPYGG